MDIRYGGRESLMFVAQFSCKQKEPQVISFNKRKEAHFTVTFRKIESIPVTFKITKDLVLGSK